MMVVPPFSNHPIAGPAVVMATCSKCAGSNQNFVIFNREELPAFPPLLGIQGTEEPVRALLKRRRIEGRDEGVLDPIWRLLFGSDGVEERLSDSI